MIAADVGIAMPRGADLTRATADVVLLRDNLFGVMQARALAGETIGQSNFAPLQSSRPSLTTVSL